MDTITIPKEKYEIMRRRISLYERIFNKFDQDFGVEIYTAERTEEFEKEDELDELTRIKANKLLDLPFKIMNPAGFLQAYF